jgi:hypothetical protein
VASILDDLVFPAVKPLDLLIHPFVPLSKGASSLGLLPHLPLYSNSEGNILRVCSRKRRDAYSVIASSKESEMLSDLRPACPSRFRPTGPVKLPDPLPDVDFVLEDSTHSSLQ